MLKHLKSISSRIQVVHLQRSICKVARVNKSVLIIKNMGHEGPGLLEEMLVENDILSTIIDLNAGDAFPTAAGFDAMIVMGGEDSANDETPKMKTEILRIRDAIDQKIPYFGVCLGLQTLVKAAGGIVKKNEVREVAFRDQEGNYFSVETMDEGKQDPIMKGLPENVAMFHLHGETVGLTPAMTLLASGKWCRNQIVRVAPRMYGMQGHLELTDTMFHDWCQKNDWLRECDQEALKRDWNEQKAQLGQSIRTFFGNFLRIANLILE